MNNKISKLDRQVNKLESKFSTGNITDVKSFIKMCKKKGGVIDCMREEIRSCNSCYIY